MNTKVTIVTGLWDMGRGDLPSGFGRSYDHYLEKFVELLKTPNNLLIYCSEKDQDLVWKYRNPKNTYVRVMELEQFDTYFPYAVDVDQMRNDPAWYLQSGWLMNSPQCKLKYYNPVVMSKMFLLNDATLYNPFNSEFFYWIDAGITNTVNSGYFWHDKVFDNLEIYSMTAGGMIVLSYPYEGNHEIHGMPRDVMAAMCGTDPKYVCRGGFFGGRKGEINNINTLYYNTLSDSMARGVMGTEENILTILSYRHTELFSKFTIGGDGLIWPFFERIKDVSDLKKQPIKKLWRDYKTNLYVLGFNSTDQFTAVCNSIKLADAEMFSNTHKILINNSTDESMFAEYDRLCEEFGFEEIHRENLGVCGGRQFIAEHFDQDDSADFCIFFEDDMMMNPPEDATTFCRMGFRKFIPNLYSTILQIMVKDKFDFLKFSFSEFYLNNNLQVAWYNVPQSVRSEVWPEYDKLPEQGFDMNGPRTTLSGVEVLDGVPYATGEVYYGNWPQIVSKEGSKKMFLDTTWAHPYEQTWMSHIFQLTRKGIIRPAILLASPITHNRFEFYPGELRKES